MGKDLTDHIVEISAFILLNLSKYRFDSLKYCLSEMASTKPTDDYSDTVNETTGPIDTFFTPANDSTAPSDMLSHTTDDATGIEDVSSGSQLPSTKPGNNSPLQSVSSGEPSDCSNISDAAADGGLQEISMLSNVKVQKSFSVNIKQQDDLCKPFICGCCFMPSGELVLCDSRNEKIKLLDSSLTLQSNALKLPTVLGVAAIDNSNVVVVFSKELQFIRVLPSFKTGKSFAKDKNSRNFNYHGIDVSGDEIYASCSFD